MRSKKAFYNILTNLLLQIVSITYGFIVPKIIIDCFGSDVNGLVVSITQFLGYIALLESGFGPVVKAVLYKPIAKRDNITIARILKTSERFFRRITMVFLVYIAVLCVVFPFITRADFDAAFTISLVLVISIGTFAEYFFGMTYRILLQAEQKTYVVSVIQITTYIIAISFVVLLALLNVDVVFIKLATGLVFLLRPIAQNLYVRKKYNIKLQNTLSDYPIKQKWDGLAQHIAAVVRGNTDIVVLTIFSTLSEVSVYSVYALVLSAIKKIVQSFNADMDSLFGDMLARNEVENLRKKFSAYELLYMILITVLFACTLILITPFVQNYTSGVHDADYARPLFGCLLTLSEFVWAIRLPYNSLTLAAGHFKETRKGAWFEAIINVVVSIVLVFNFGIVGVAIGTLVAMAIRTVEFVYHANKYILKRGTRTSVGKILLAVFIASVAITIYAFVPMNFSHGYFEWGIGALIAFLVVSTLTILLYTMFYRKEMRGVIKWLEGKAKRFRTHYKKYE